MGYNLSGFIAKRGTFDDIRSLSAYVSVAELEQDFCLLLSDWWLEEALKITVSETHPDYVDMDISKSLVDTGIQLSNSTAIAYIEIDFFGGNGTQKSVVWRNGEMALMPSKNGEFGGIPDRDGSVNAVLRNIGVQAYEYDEFLSVGLAKH